MSLYSKEIPKSDLLYRKVVLPGKKFLNKYAIKKSLCSSHKETPRCLYFPGSLTIEAAFIVPILLYFFVCILFFFRVIQVQIVVQSALNQAGRQMAVLEENKNELVEIGVAQSIFIKELTDKEVIGSYVKGGVWGINFLHSVINEDEIGLRVVYEVQLPIELFWDWSFSMEQRVDCRRWNGWHNEADSNDGTDDTWVYITETGDVYHVNKKCTHLVLSIQSVPRSQLEKLRNQSGGRYQSCKQCDDRENKWDAVYITNYGNYYHCDLTCSGIKRTVYTVRKSEVEDMPCCSRCSASGEKYE